MGNQDKSKKEQYGKEYDEAVASGNISVYGDLTRGEFISLSMADTEADRVYGKGKWDR